MMQSYVVFFFSINGAPFGVCRKQEIDFKGMNLQEYGMAWFQANRNQRQLVLFSGWNTECHLKKNVCLLQAILEALSVLNKRKSKLALKWWMYIKRDYKSSCFVIFT